MKNQVIFRRLLKGIGLPLGYFWAGALILWFVIWLVVFQFLGVNGSLASMPIGIWLAVFAGLSYFNTESAFDLAMQTGVSRRHVFLDLMVIWSGCTLLTALILGLWSFIAPMPHLFIQDLGYRGSASLAVLIANVFLVGLSLMVAALVGILARIAAMKVSEDNRWWFWLGLVVVFIWLSLFDRSAQATQWLAQIYWVWPLVLAVVLGGLLLYLRHQFQVIEPRN
ncbi:hypothetical protein [Lacticaseibacillus porcinae]|uniref:hypothetical protein n=1 Tax=Lacticaseibacillus porcinae TaxID=1123687 RepID=UPI000F773B67|nr:hypothetical protein [Lacticaseibacillus porcinae]